MTGHPVGYWFAANEVIHSSPGKSHDMIFPESMALYRRLLNFYQPKL